MEFKDGETLYCKKTIYRKFDTFEKSGIKDLIAPWDFFTKGNEYHIITIQKNIIDGLDKSTMWFKLENDENQIVDISSQYVKKYFYSKKELRKLKLSQLNKKHGTN